MLNETVTTTDLLIPNLGHVGREVISQKVGVLEDGRTCDPAKRATSTISDGQQRSKTFMWYMLHCIDDDSSSCTHSAMD
jgi:hypothetical protein